ncbi:MAG: PhzF family phenazine biosynthesis protein [Acidimicrobiales bacterium]
MSTTTDKVTVRVVRVFTRDGAGGNPLGIHEGLLADGEMQDVAATLGYSETIFLDRSTSPIGVRIFTPAAELPFAGHPLVGATWHIAEPGAPAMLRCGVGDVAGQRSDAEVAAIRLHFRPPVEVATAPAGVVRAWIARMPLPFEVSELATPDTVAGYVLTDRPDHRLVWAAGDAGRPDTVRARFFAPGFKVDEDPATGSAAVALAAVLRHEGEPSGSLTIHQGSEIGAPSRIDLAWSESHTAIGGAVADDGLRTVSVRPGS